MEVKVNIDSVSVLDEKLIRTKQAAYDVQFIIVKPCVVKPIDMEEVQYSSESVKVSDIENSLQNVIDSLNNIFRVRSMEQTISGIFDRNWQIQLSYNRNSLNELQILFNPYIPVESKSKTVRKVCSFLKTLQENELMAAVHYRVLILGDTKAVKKRNRMWKGLVNNIEEDPAVHNV
jgi:hypothetical protein